MSALLEQELLFGDILDGLADSIEEEMDPIEPEGKLSEIKLLNPDRPVLDPFIGTPEAVYKVFRSRVRRRMRHSGYADSIKVSYFEFRNITQLPCFYCQEYYPNQMALTKYDGRFTFCSLNARSTCASCEAMIQVCSEKYTERCGKYFLERSKNIYLNHLIIRQTELTNNVDKKKVAIVL